VSVNILIGDARERLRELPDQSVHCCVTSPPYFGLRDYGCEGQMGLEATPADFVEGMVRLFREVRRVLRDDGTLWLNLGDSYAGSWGAQGHRVTESDNASWHGSQIKNHPKRGRQTGTIREAGLKAKDLIGIPWRVAFALQADGWWLRQDIIWSKPNPMPESVRDRCTKAHEYLFLLSKGPRYYYDCDAIREPIAESSKARLSQDVAAQRGSDRVPGKTNGPMKAVAPRGMRSNELETFRLTRGTSNPSCVHEAGANRRSVWTIPTQPFSEAHFATFPPAFVEPIILAGCPTGGTVLDPFGGAGTTGLVADRLGRDAILIELNPEYAAIAERRIAGDAGMFAEVRAA
jgi:DNA modification methylase